MTDWYTTAKTSSILLQLNLPHYLLVTSFFQLRFTVVPFPRNVGGMIATATRFLAMYHQPNHWRLHNEAVTQLCVLLAPVTFTARHLCHLKPPGMVTTDTTLLATLWCCPPRQLLSRCLPNNSPSLCTPGRTPVCRMIQQSVLFSHPLANLTWRPLISKELITTVNLLTGSCVRS